MQTKLSFFLLLIFTIVITLSCASSPPPPPIDPESLIGTKWVPCNPAPMDLSLEIIDNEKCFYTVGNTKYDTNYTIRGNTLSLPAFNTSWFINRDYLYNRKGGKAIFVKK